MYYEYNNNNRSRKIVISVLALIVIALATGLIIHGLLNSPSGAKIEYSDTERSATLTIGENDVTNIDSEEHGLGAEGEEIEVDNIETVESVDAPGPVVDTDAGEGVSLVNCPEEEECGLGAYIYAPVESWSAFKNYTIGNCYDTDGSFGGQCWDLADLFWQNATGRRAQTCGTGAAKGMIRDGCWQKNAGNDFTMIWNPQELRPGDWLIFTNGTWGHVGMALGTYNNGYITLLGQNQGGKTCPGGGSATNIINISLKNFGGAFRLKNDIIPEPAPQPEPTPKPQPENPTSVNEYTVGRGDTLGSIIRKLGWYNGNELYGDNGYAQKVASANGIKNRGMIFPGQVIRRI